MFGVRAGHRRTRRLRAFEVTQYEADARNRQRSAQPRIEERDEPLGHDARCAQGDTAAHHDGHHDGRRYRLARIGRRARVVHRVLLYGVGRCVGGCGRQLHTALLQKLEACVSGDARHVHQTS